MRIGGAHADQNLSRARLRCQCFNKLEDFRPAEMAELDGSHWTPRVTGCSGEVFAVSSNSVLRTLWCPTYQEVTVKAPMKRLPLLPAERALKVIAGRWKAVILYHLFDGPKRLSELKRLAPNVSQKVLVQQLREMEEHGLVNREIYRQVPPRVDYSATPLGLSLEPVIMSLCEWGRRHAAELNELDGLMECEVGRPARKPRLSSKFDAMPIPVGQVLHR
jgi:DNA-binding HxlR family transcriptional regulator